MRTPKIVFALGIVALASSVPFALADPPPLAPEAPLTMPTPAQPKLRVQQMAPPPASLMLDSVRPLQLPQSQQRPTLNRFPGVEADSNDDSEGMAGQQEEEPRIHLQHHH
jgi:hypothetical protein